MNEKTYKMILFLDEMPPFCCQSEVSCGLGGTEMYLAKSFSSRYDKSNTE